jgi:hypothetical protein
MTSDAGKCEKDMSSNAATAASGFGFAGNVTAVSATAASPVEHAVTTRPDNVRERNTRFRKRPERTSAIDRRVIAPEKMAAVLRIKLPQFHLRP